MTTIQPKKSQTPRNKFLIPALIFTISLLVRTYKIHMPKSVLWDEAHFGKFALQYLLRTFYFDVHPPFGRLLTTFFGILSGQPLDFEFKSATDYPRHFNYVFMRTCHAIMGSLVPMFAELTLNELGFGNVRYFICLLMIFENGFVSISRLILLDSHLLAFSSATIYALTRYLNNKSFLNMLILGSLIGCVMSIKWIGCLTTLLVGGFIIHELVCSFCDRDTKLLETLKKFLLRALTLIVLPITIYLAFFYLHFYILENYSSSTTYVNSMFGLTLKNSKQLENNKQLLKYVDYGHPVSLKSGYEHLHSHNDVYPNTKINQVTGYNHIDSNNEWAFQKVTEDSDTNEFLESGMDVALLHMKTRRYLGVGQSKAFISSDFLRAECKNKKLLEENIFKLEFVSDWNKNEQAIKSASTSFRVVFTFDKDYYLKLSGKKYPEWGFKQAEVVFTDKKSEASLWHIEHNFKSESTSQNNPLYTQLVESKFLFFKFVKDLNFSMFRVNKSFSENEDEERARIVSDPYEWFFGKRGIRMGHWDDESEKFYMFINPLVWTLSGICVLLSPIIYTYRLIRNKRKHGNFERVKREGLIVSIMFLGWVFHYLPFFYIGRVLYFHHYFPALYFATLSIAYIFENVNYLILGLLGVLNVAIFTAYAPLTYGFRRVEEAEHLRAFTNWDFVGE